VVRAVPGNAALSSILRNRSTDSSLSHSMETIHLILKIFSGKDDDLIMLGEEIL
jgi:hypothetical protein